MNDIVNKTFKGKFYIKPEQRKKLEKLGFEFDNAPGGIKTMYKVTIKSVEHDTGRVFGTQVCIFCGNDEKYKDKMTGTYDRESGKINFWDKDGSGIIGTYDSEKNLIDGKFRFRSEDSWNDFIGEGHKFVEKKREKSGIDPFCGMPH